MGSALAELQAHVRAMEEAYEFFLAYAAQGLPDDRQSPVGRQLREHLERSVDACRLLPELVASAAAEAGLGPAPAYEAFASVLAADADRARVMLELVLAQPGISSQLIDNLNAVIHVRALLTDLFVIDEILSRRLPAQAAAV